ncbi:MAG: low-specificity L-threonine aldolase [Dehalococcoidia bacterium]|nr:low-specificity L-threonine aldolase [Chloroflexota bacterium]MDP6056371.1 low-specificity L-threonine aldolase [Dehalococcoidia bacterium]MDP7261577.1 low-specificity L-threonine aldolase [Dehalococcoidia bacterium]MDP7485585.1 low-specificity L-threonine aldolase [Dehalococcoidia bacterium]
MIRVDLRSDTVTHPSPEMRRAMYEAELGDDVYGDDPTVNELQQRAADMLGKEAGLFVSSGTQGNLVSVLSHAQRGDEVLVGDQCHIMNAEAGGAMVLGSVVLFPIKTNEFGFLEPDLIKAAVNPRDYHKPPTRLLTIENTHNASSGRALNADQMKTMADAAHEMGLNVHLDGARIFNAAIALRVPASDLTENVDSATFCLSKGLSCPIGSIVVGSKDFIEEADRWRKMLGSGMRQVGVVAAAGLVALDSMIDRMQEDHDSARHIASRMAEMKGITVDPEHIQTNIIRFGVPAHTGNRIAARMKEEGVYINGGDSDLRIVTHYGVSSEDYEFTISALDRVMNEIA